MRILCILLPLLHCSSLVQAQNLQVDGKLQVTDMEISNSEEYLVVKQADGTLAQRFIGSLPSGNSNSGVRSFESDIALTHAICECENLPSFLVESALSAGYTESQLYEAGGSVKDIYAGGGSLLELYNAGASIGSMLLARIPVLNILSEGIPKTAFYGLIWEAGYIYEVNEVTGDIHLINQNPFGFNTRDDALAISENGSFLGYRNWTLPTDTELLSVYQNIYLQGIDTDQFSADHYWSKTTSGNLYFYVDFATGGLESTTNSISEKRFRPVRIANPIN